MATMVALALAGCTPTGAGRWCDQENEVALLAQTPAGIPALRIREVQGPFVVELTWSALRSGYANRHSAREPMFDGQRTVATLFVEGRPGPATFAQSTEDGECGDGVLLVPVALTMRTEDGRVDTTFQHAEAEFRDGASSVMGWSEGLAVQGAELPDCDPYSTSAGFEMNDGNIRPFLHITCKADPEIEAYMPAKLERLAVIRPEFVLGTWGERDSAEVSPTPGLIPP